MKDSNFDWDGVFFVILIIAIFVFLYFSSTAHAEQSISIQGGEHYLTSGQTFIHSKKDDRGFDGYCWQVEYTGWLPVDNWGIGVSYGENKGVKEEMFSDRYYDMKLKTGEIIAKYRWQGEQSDWRIGAGVSYSTLDHSYSIYSEQIRGYGWVAEIGVDYYLDESKRGWFATSTIKYVENDLQWGMIKNTSARIGGGKWLIGVGYCW